MDTFWGNLSDHRPPIHASLWGCGPLTVTTNDGLFCWGIIPKWAYFWFRNYDKSMCGKIAAKWIPKIFTAFDEPWPEVGKWVEAKEQVKDAKRGAVRYSVRSPLASDQQHYLKLTKPGSKHHLQYLLASSMGGSIELEERRWDWLKVHRPFFVSGSIFSTALLLKNGEPTHHGFLILTFREPPRCSANQTSRCRRRVDSWSISTISVKKLIGCGAMSTDDDPCHECSCICLRIQYIHTSSHTHTPI